MILLICFDVGRCFCVLLEGEIVLVIGVCFNCVYEYIQDFCVEAFRYFGVDSGGFGVSGLFTQMTR